MTPNARIAAAIDVLDRILDGYPAEQVLLRWSRGARYAGSGDRAAVRDLVFDSLRRRNSRAALGGSLSGAGLMLGMCQEQGIDPANVFTGQGHDPSRIDLTVSSTGAGDQLDLPEWILPAWRQSLGEQADAIALAMRDRAPVWLRVNPLRATVDQARAELARAGIDTQPTSKLTGALQVTSGERRISGTTAYRNGWVELQDLSAQIACAAVPLTLGDTVLDYCAGGGGKSLALAGRGCGPVTAYDANPDRMRDLPVRADRAGADIRIQSPKGHFDLVIADVPCSGTGTWRRTPDAKWRLRADDLSHLLDLQARIMVEAAPFVRPGGHLVYMTCSVLDDENARQIDRFLERNSCFDEASRTSLSPLNESDGFFCCVLKRSGTDKCGLN